MTHEDIQVIYAAKRKIRENAVIIADGIKQQDYSRLIVASEQNQRIRREIRERYGIILE